VRTVTGVAVPAGAFDAAKVPAHLRVNFAVDDERGTTLATGKDLDALRAELAPKVRAAIARSTPIEERRGITTWDFGDLPESVESQRGGITVRGFPTLLDDGDSVSIRVLSNPDLQAKVMRVGVRRLLLLAVPVGKRAVERDLTNQSKLAIAGARIMSLEALAADCVTAAADRVMADHGEVPFTADGFAALVAFARDHLPDHAARLLRTAADVLGAATAVQARLAKLVAPAVVASADDAAAQLARLVRPGFVVTTGPDRLADVLRFVKAIDLRLTKLPEAPQKDQNNLRDVLALERRYTDLLRRTHREDITPELIDIGWMLEELRVSVFAQTLGAARGTSPARIQKALQANGG
jgi:ATP-dependent helicase HrpA